MTTLQFSPRKRGAWIALILTAQLSFLLANTACTSKSRDDNPEEQLQTDEATDQQAAAADVPDEDLLKNLADEELGRSPAPKSAPDLSIPAKQEMSTTDAGSEIAISDIRYVARRGGGTVVVETSSPATYHTREVPSQSQVIIEIANAQLPERLKRPYVTKDFGQSISSVNAYQDKGSSTVRIVVQFRSPMHADVARDGRELRLTPADAVAELEDSPGSSDRRDDDRRAEARRNDSAGASASASSGEPEAAGLQESTEGDEPVKAASSGNDSDRRILPAMPPERMATDNIKFYGKPISIEVRDTAVRDVINLIADQSGANIVLAGEIDGNISLKLRQVPWDQALLIVMRTRNLGYVRQGSILRVAPFEALQKEAEAAKRVVDARRNAEPLRVRIIPVGYAKVDQLEKQVSPFLTLQRGKVVGDVRTNSLIVTDTPDVLERVANLVKALDLPPLQVLIEGKVIEARETFSRDFGIRWGFQGGVPADLGGGRSLAPSYDMNGLTLPTTGGTLGFRIGQFDVFGDIQASIGLAESQNQVKIVSSPRVVAINNEVATIVQGTNIAIPSVSQVNGTTVTTFQYTPIEMKLEVTPQVTSENDVIMQIQIKRDFQGARTAGNQPDINRREAKTKVLVRNGQTAVVGGVYQADANDGENGIPWLRSLPVLGWLFKNKSTSNEKTELLVFLTPRILNAETSLQKENTL